MILTCPECATRYSVDGSKIGPEGKTVRCAGCHHRWMAFPDAEVELVATVVEPEQAEIAPQPDLEPPLSLREKPAAAVPRAFREKAEAGKTMRQAVAQGITWAVMGTLCLALGGLGVVFRSDVVRIAPRTASAYEALGLKVNPTGLEFEGVAIRQALQEGHQALVISGAVRNIETHSVPALPIRISLLDKAGKAISHRISPVGANALKPGETRHFVVSVLDPPATAQGVDVTFAVGHKAAPAPHGAPAAAHPGSEGALRGSLAPGAHPTPPAGHEPMVEAVEAQPLPAGSPYGLPAAKGAPAGHAPPHG